RHLLVAQVGTLALGLAVLVPHALAGGGHLFLHGLQARLVSFQLGLARLAASICLPGQAPPLLPGHGLATRGPAVVTSQLDHRTHADAALAVRPPDGASICRLVAIACLAPAIPDVKARLAELGLYPCSDRPPDVA